DGGPSPRARDQPPRGAAARRAAARAPLRGVGPRRHVLPLHAAGPVSDGEPSMPDETPDPAAEPEAVESDAVLDAGRPASKRLFPVVGIGASAGGLEAVG